MALLHAAVPVLREMVAEVEAGGVGGGAGRGEGFQSKDAFEAVMRRAVGALPAALEAATIAVAALKLRAELREARAHGLAHYLGGVGSQVFENACSCAGCALVLGAGALHAARALAGGARALVAAERLCLAGACFVGWLYLLFFAMAFRFTGPFIVMVTEMLARDVRRFGVLLFIFQAAFASATLQLGSAHDGASGLVARVVAFFKILVGEYDGASESFAFATAPFPLILETMVAACVAALASSRRG